MNIIIIIPCCCCVVVVLIMMLHCVVVEKKMGRRNVNAKTDAQRYKTRILSLIVKQHLC